MATKKFAPVVPASDDVAPFLNAAVEPFQKVQETIHAAFEKGLTQTTQGAEQLRKSTEDATKAMEKVYALATEQATALNLKVIETAKANAMAAFELATALAGAKTVAAAVELQTSHARKQFEALTAQAKDMAAFMQKAANDVSEPLKAVASNARFPL
jgi:phasin